MLNGIVEKGEDRIGAGKKSADGFDPRNPAHAITDGYSNSYTHVEEFINGLDPRCPAPDWTDLKHNLDPRNGA